MIELVSVFMQVAVRLVMRINPNSSLFDICGYVQSILKLEANNKCVTAPMTLGSLSATTLFILRDELRHHDPTLSDTNEKELVWTLTLTHVGLSTPAAREAFCHEGKHIMY